ncbi:hypothetical protein CsSME_00010990 [Camellia sinensis var. sinensis]
MAAVVRSKEVVWSGKEDREFENAIAKYLKSGSEEEWKKIASEVSNKSIEQVKLHYQILLEDLKDIDDGFVPLPHYTDDHHHHHHIHNQPSSSHDHHHDPF